MEGFSLLSGTSITSDEPGLCPSLSLQQRVIGCAFCVSLGYLLSFGAMGRVIDLVKGDPQPFVVFFTFGNLLSLAGSCFLSGPENQLKQMFDKKRRGASAVLFAALGLTIFVALQDTLPGQAELLVALLLTQLLAQAYYVLTYVPFGTDMLKTCCSKVTGLARGESLV